ncbi:hypothetical protein [Niveispirillum fermenti]|uniref:hypothetical protein n=1 Tax=Niveispirillum fermenti TaxID=1233113 RepID=UPI003A8513C5
MAGLSATPTRAEGNAQSLQQGMVPKSAVPFMLPAEPTPKYQLKFPDFGYMPPPTDYTGRVFVLSQDFPKTKPAIEPAVEKILKIDYRKDWRAYLDAVKQYVFQGNIDAENGVEDDFFLEDNTVRRWFHVPWQHWGPNGREGYHGLTKEGPLPVGSLAPEQTVKSSAYAVGFYNAMGGWTIGQLWPSAQAPDMSYFQKGGGFPDGTVVAKLLFTTLDESQVPYLTNPVSWNAYVYQADVPGMPAPPTPGQRVTAKVHLLQMDIMVRDSRLDKQGGWVFGTYVYNGRMGKANPWENLVPVGLMWGNNPEVTVSHTNPTPTATRINPAITETIINPDTRELPPMHLGWNSRLNGPADNSASSCMSCHSTAQYPAISAIMPQFNNPAFPTPPDGQDAGPEFMLWFRNIPWGQAFNKGHAVSLDFSLQMQGSIINWIAYTDSVQQGRFSAEYWSKGNRVSRNPGPAPAQ